MLPLHAAQRIPLGPDVVVHDEQPDAGKLGHRWEAMGLWLVAVLAVDVLGYLGRAIQAVSIGRKVPSPAMTMIMFNRHDHCHRGASPLFPVWDPGLISSRTAS